MSPEAVAKAEKRFGRRAVPLCHWHAFRVGLTRGGRRCGARCSAKRRPWNKGKPCEAFAIRGQKRCRAHGGRNGGLRRPKYSAAEKEAMKRAQVELSDWLWEQQRRKERRPKPVQWQPEPERSVEDVFKEHRRPRPKRWTPY